MHSDVLNCDNKAAFPTSAAPSMHTVYESTGPGLAEVGSLLIACAEEDDFIGLVGGIKLLLLDRRRLNESPLFTMPAL
jgi:hypothetical protein